MENSPNQSQQAGGMGVLIEPSWAYAGVGIYSALVFLIVIGLYIYSFDWSLHLTVNQFAVSARRSKEILK